MIDIFSFTIGFILGFSLSTLFIYLWIRRYVSKLLGNKEQILKNIIDLLESKRK